MLERKDLWRRDDMAGQQPLFPDSALNAFRSTEELVARLKSGKRGVDYRRYGCAAERAVEFDLARYAGAEDALLVPSGMAAISLTLQQIFFEKPGTLILGKETYKQTQNFARTRLNRMGVTVVDYDTNANGSLADLIDQNTRAIFLECPTNPYLRVPNLEEIIAICKRHGVITIFDTTLASPINLRPIELGADFVTDSVTKYLGGHHDLIAGVVWASKDRLSEVRTLRGQMGVVSSPDVAHTLERYLGTLSLRVNQHNITGMAVARYLQHHPAVEKVWYPGLESHPDYANATKLKMPGFGGVVTFTVRGDLERTSAFIDALEVPIIGASFGGIEPLIEQPRIIAHYDKTSEEARAIGITDNLVRLSVGLADSNRLIEDLGRTLTAKFPECE